MGKLSSIKQKAEFYDKAIERAKSKILYPDKPCFVDINEIFPELVKSEDEQIRERLIRYFKDFRLGTFADIEPKKIIAWLERQGEPKPVDCSKSEPVLKPKFHKGDLIVNNRNGWVCQVTEIRDDEYCIWPLYCEMKGYSRIIDVDDDYHLWTIADAKDGDVLAFKNNIGGIIICKSPTDYDTGSYCRLMDYNFITKEESGWDSRLLIPAPKEGRDLLFRKIHEEGYKWDAEKKELKIALKEMQESIDDAPFEQKSTECSEQNNWKPTEEQINALSIAIRCGIQLGSEEEKALRSLRKQLRELKKQEK